MSTRLAAARSAALAAILVLAGPAQAATITIVTNDGPGEGFNDPTVVAPEGGNPGTTLGQQRLNVFQAAASVWAATLQSNIAIKVGARFDPQTCSQFSAVLGSAGPNGVVRDFPGAPLASTWYHIALGESLASSNFNMTSVEINATFNSAIDTGCFGNPPRRWWYGTSPAIPPAANTVALFPVVLHELGHGLGFSTQVCVVAAGCGPQGNEGSIPQGSLLQGFNDSWVPLLRDVSQALNWSAMTNAQRATSMTNDPNLVWTGAQVTAAIPTFAPTGAGVNGAGANARMRMNAPSPVVPGSSVSHFTSAAANPDLLMEPSLSTGLFNQTDMTVPLLRDIGWQIMGGAANQPPVITRPASIQVTEDVASNITGISFTDPDIGGGNLTATFSVGAGSFNSPGCANVTSGGTASARTLTGTLGNLNACLASGLLRYTTAQDATASVTLTVTANDNGNTGSGGAQSDTEMVTLNITAVNDPPVNNVPASITVTEDVATGLAGISFTDVDSGTGFLMVTLAVPSGSVDAMTCSGVGVSGSASSRRFTGNLTQLNACFASAANRPRFTTAPNATANVTLTVSTTDNGNTGTGSFGNDSDTVTLNVSAVNDAPELALPASIAIQMTGATPLTGIGVADVDAGNADVRLTLTVPLGTLTATAGGGVTVTGSGTPTLLLAGTIAELNAFLAAGSARYVAGGETMLTLTLSDLGATGSGGPMTATGSVPLIAAALFADGFE